MKALQPSHLAGPRSGLTLLQPSASPWRQSYGYDGAERLTNVPSPAGVFTLEYGSVRVALPGTLTLPNGASIATSYDFMARLTNTTLRSSQQAVLNHHGYGYNAASQRTSVTNLAGNAVGYTYDRSGQLTQASGKEAAGTTRLNEQFGYGYDTAGNLAKRTNDFAAAEPLVQTFSITNLLNQLTSVTRSGKLTVAGTTTTNATSVTVNGVAASRYGDTTFAKDGFTLTNGVNSFTAVAQDALGRLDTNMVTVNLPATVSFTYDDNGNLLNDGRRLLGYDDENQLTSVIVTNGVNNSTLSKFAYDGFGRRRVRTECVWQNGGWATNALVRYVYDGMVVLQERDGNNLPTVTYTRGRDLSGSLQGAGGIGGLLSRTDQTTPTWSHAYYQADGNGNVMCLINEKQAVVARYVYEPFGNVLSMSGPLAEVNLYRFSSKEAHPVSGLVYYRFRFYDPNLQRWVNRDPIGEVGGANLYAYVQGSPLNFADPFGLIPGVPPGAPGNPPVVPRYQTPIEPFPKDGWGQKGWPDGRVGRAWDPNWEGNHLERPEGSHHPRLPPRITPPCGCPPGNCPGHIASTHPEPAARSDAAAPAYPLVWRGPYRGLEQLPMPIPPPKPATNVTRPWGGIIQRNVPPVNLPR